MPNIDPETFRGKLYLLLVDKVVIGALIAVALLVYDQWKTHEVRVYTAAQEEAQRAFSRAEYVKQLVPIVLDSKQDILYRAHSLRALVETHSIDANSAVPFAQKLLDANVLGAEVPAKIRFSGQSATQDYPFFATMQKTMPSGLPSLLNQYRFKFPFEYRSDGTRKWVKRPRRGEDEVFWERLFWDTIYRHKDSDLKLLGSDEFLAENFGVLDAITPDFPTRGEADDLAKREVKGLRILGSIRLLAMGREADAHAVMQLELAIDPTNQDPHALELAAEIVKQLSEGELLCRSLSNRLLAIILRRQDVTLHRKHFGDRRSPVEDRFHAATEYLEKCAKGWAMAEQLEPHALPVLREFYEQLEKTPVDSPLKLRYPASEFYESNYYPVEWAFIRILMNTSASDSKAEQLLSTIFSLPQGKLDQGGLYKFVEEWKNARISMLELVGVWKDADGYYSFNADGTFGYTVTRSALSAGRLDAQGTFSLKGDVLIFESDNVCGKQKGVYRLQAKTGSKLTFTQVKEDCRQRRLLFLERIR